MNNTHQLQSIDEGVSILLPYIKTSHPQNPPFILAIDGRCASGKTSLAAALSKAYGCPVIHMDDFFLPPSMRTPERLDEAGGNVDRERFAKEVLTPLRAGLPFSYSPFDCHTLTYGSPVEIDASPLVIIEGSYACHPDLVDAYDLRVFMTVTPHVQAARILSRNGETSARIFASRWIPLEEKYFNAFDISDQCDVIFNTSFA